MNIKLFFLYEQFIQLIMKTIIPIFIIKCAYNFFTASYHNIDETGCTGKVQFFVENV